MSKRKDMIQGFLDTLPVGICVAIYGVVYGVLGGKAGLSLLAVLGMSLFVFAGASQIAAVQMLAQGAHPVSIIMMIYIINLRHYLMAASLAPYLDKTEKRLKMLTSFFLTDESYAVTYSKFQKEAASVWYFWGSSLNIYVLWGAAGVIGYLCGSVIPSQWNFIFDFAFVAAFLGMLVPLVKDFPAVVAVIVSAVLSFYGSIFIPGKWYILIGAIVGSLSGYLVLRAKAQLPKELPQEVITNE